MPAFKVVEVTCQSESGNLLRKVKSGHLTIQGPAMKHGGRDNDWHLDHDFEKLRLDFLDEGKNKDGQLGEHQYKTWILVLVSAGKNEQRPGTTDIVGLVLKPVLRTTNLTMFERIGTFEAGIDDDGEMHRLAKAWISQDSYVDSFTIV